MRHRLKRRKKKTIKNQRTDQKRNNFRTSIGTLRAERTLKESDALFILNYPPILAQNSLYWPVRNDKNYMTPVYRINFCCVVGLIVISDSSARYNRMWIRTNADARKENFSLLGFCFSSSVCGQIAHTS